VDPSQLVSILTVLTALQGLYRTAHWKSGGPHFQADHDLFAGLYAKVQEQQDALAERIIGLADPEAVDHVQLATMSAQMLASWRQNGSLLDQALFAEQQLQQHLNSVIQLLEQSGQMTPGLDDLLASIAAEHEEALYLLKQRAHGAVEKTAMPAFVRALTKEAVGPGAAVGGIAAGSAVLRRGGGALRAAFGGGVGAVVGEAVYDVLVKIMLQDKQKEVRDLAVPVAALASAVAGEVAGRVTKRKEEKKQ
jgi:DNA-binding ferritin-like protein/outer membrane lipoprotein SlyB